MFQPLLGGSAQVWFMSEPEHQLAHRIGPVSDRHFVTGEGVLIPDSYDPGGFRAKYGITRPYVLFAGRREGGKGWSDLLRRGGLITRIAPYELVCRDDLTRAALAAQSH